MFLWNTQGRWNSEPKINQSSSGTYKEMYYHTPMWKVIDLLPLTNYNNLKNRRFLTFINIFIYYRDRGLILGQNKKGHKLEHHSFTPLRIYWSLQRGKLFKNVVKCPWSVKNINTFFSLLGDLVIFLLYLVELRNHSKFRDRAQFVL